MEEWLQTEWWDFKVWTANLTEQSAQIAVAGPAARKVLEAAGTSADISREGLPFMHWTPGMVAGIPARIHRISFTGELSYEIAVPADRGQALWDALREAGADFALQPYGTEAMHVMRAEKGFIIVGDESDGTVTPQDLGLGWAVSKKKADFIGKRAQDGPELTRAGRKQLVGLATLDADTVLPDGAHAISGPVRTGEPTPTIGHVTSAYFSPTLGRSIALALIEGGASRRGEVLDFPLETGTTIRATVVGPVFFDSEGARQDA
jgi:sarcosine oxidase subunit alpha